MNTTTQRLKVLHLTAMYPVPGREFMGTFVKSQIDSLAPYADCEVLPVIGILNYFKNIGTIRKAIKKDFDLTHIHYADLATFVKWFYKGPTPIVTSYCGDD